MTLFDVMSLIIIIILMICLSITASKWVRYGVEALHHFFITSVKKEIHDFYVYLHTAPESWPRITNMKGFVNPSSDEGFTKPFMFKKLDHMLGWSLARRPFAKKYILIASTIIITSTLTILTEFLTALIIIISVIVILYVLLQYRADKNRELFITSLPYALDSLVQSLRAGHSFPQAIEFVKKEATGLTYRVFDAFDRGLKYRIPLDTILTSLQEEIGLKEWNLFIESMYISEKTGGNSIPLIEQSAASIRENSLLKRELAAATTSSRTSSTFIIVLTLTVFVVLTLFNPSYMSVFFETTFGKILIATATILMVTGFIIIRRLVNSMH